MIGCVLSLLGDVPEVMAKADPELAQCTVNQYEVRAIR